MWIKNEIKKIVSKYSTNNPFEIAERKRIIVCIHPLHSEIMGYYKYIRRNKFIVINSYLDDNNKLFTCAHELGHAQLHPRIDTPFLKKATLFSTNKIENEANRFAVEMLLPDSVLEEYRFSKLSLEEIAVMHGIPREVARLKKYNFF